MSDPEGAKASAHADLAPRIDGAAVSFRFPDPDGRYRAVRLYQEINRPRPGPDLRRAPEGRYWELRWSRPPADRLEYQFEIETVDGLKELVCDPSNPRRTSGPFGEKSVIELPTYMPPAWVGTTPPQGEVAPLSLKSRILHRELHVEVWSAHATTWAESLPLLVVHDGPEYARYSQLTHYLDHLIATEAVVPFRAALIAPIDRNETYSASATYERAMTHDVLPGLAAIGPIPHGRLARVGMGASLGALAMLHTHRKSPANFGGLFLQSGSYFRLRYDKQESAFSRFRRISRFVGGVLSPGSWASTVPVTITCGLAEENLANNRAVFEALRAQGYDIAWGGVRDAHNWTSWRDALDPHLGLLLAKLWNPGPREQPGPRELL